MRVVIDAKLSVRNLDLPKEFDRALPVRPSGAPAVMLAKRFADLTPYRFYWIKSAHRILYDKGYPLPSDPAHGPLWQPEKLLSLEPDFPPSNFARGLDEAYKRQR
jgi:hypothetical protein